MPRPIARRAALGFCAAAAFTLAAPAFADTVAGNGVIRTQQRAVSGITGVALGIPARVEVKVGNAEGVTLEADENLLPLIETTVRRGTLEIKPARRSLDLSSKAIHIVVQAKSIEQLSLGGSGSITADAVQGRKLALEIGGSGSVEVQRADVERVAVAIGGAGRVKLDAGSARKLEMNVGGSGATHASGFVVDDADVTIAGAGDADLAVRSRLEVTIAGSGSVRYLGDPKLDRTVIGAGLIRRMGPLPQ